MQAALPALNDEFRATWGMELQQPHRGQHRRGHRRRRQRRAAAGHRRRGQHGGAARAGGRSRRDRHRRPDLPPGARPDRGRGHPAADAQGQGRAGRRAYRLIAVRGPRAESASVTTPFVGREPPRWSASRRRCWRSAANQSCELLTVIGDAGVGKSRLIREFVARARPGNGARSSAAAACPTATVSRSGRSPRSSASAAGINDEDPLGGGARQDRARRSQRGRRRGRPDRRRRPRRRGDRSVHGAVPGRRSCSGAIRKLLEAIASRPAARGHRRRHPRRRADVPGAHRSPARGRPGRPDPDPGLRPPRAARRTRRVGRDARGVADHARAAVARRGRVGSSTSCSAALDASVRRRIRRPPRATRCTSSRSSRCSSRPARSRRDGDGWVAMTSSERPGHPADGRGTGRRPPRRPRAGRARRRRPGLGDRARLRGRGGRPSRPRRPRMRSRCASGR